MSQDKLDSVPAAANSAVADSNSTYNTWFAEYRSDMTQFLNDLQTFDQMCAKGEDPGLIIMFAMSHLFQDKMTIGQDEMKEQAYAIQDLSSITNQVSALQSDLQSGNYKAYVADWGKIASSVMTSGSQDPWLQSYNTTITSSDGSLSVDYNFGGLLGQGPGSALDSLQTELGVTSTSEGTNLSALIDENTFNAACYNLTGQEVNGYTPPPLPVPLNGNSSPGPTPANPSMAQQYVNDFSEATSQVSSASSFANNELQYQQQDYQKITQSVQDTLSDVMSLIQQINQNVAST